MLVFHEIKRDSVFKGFNFTSHYPYACVYALGAIDW